MQGHQTPVSATISSPAWYLATNINTPVFQYGIEGRPFVSERGYAWYVVALEGKKEVTRSDIGHFIWRNCANTPLTATDNPNVSSLTNNTRKKGIQYYQMPAFEEPVAMTVTDKSLNIIYIASTALKTVFARLENEKGELISSREIPITPGYNFLSLEQAAWKMEPLKYHTLSMMNERGEIQRLKFWYRPKS
jgi:hypothetical protein